MRDDVKGTMALGGFSEVMAALALFFATHSVPAVPGVRGRLVSMLGRRFYVVLHSVVATAALAWLIAATLRAPYVELWGFHPWTRWVPLLVMPVACMLLVAGLTSPNPFSLGRGGRGYDPARPGIVAITRHPTLWAAALWAFAHLFPNGDLRAVLLFGGMGGFSLMGMVLFDRRRAAQLGRVEWRRLLAATARQPSFAGLAWRAGLGLVLYAALLFAHGPLFGRYPLG